MRAGVVAGTLCNELMLPHTTRQPMALSDRPSLLPLLARLDIDAEREAAINDLLEHCQERFVLLTRRMLRGIPTARAQGDTEDAYQRAAIRLTNWLRKRSVNSPMHFIRVAARAIRHTLLDMARKRTGHIRSGDAVPHAAAGAFAEGDSTNDPAKLALWSEFHACVAALPAGQRKVFELRYYRG